jgi:predicted ATP-grasp superfamily ATP-dependent carboligase
LLKRAASCGGQGVAYFSPQYAAVDSTCYYQKYTPGQVMSVLFIADGETHRTIGYNLLSASGSGAPAPFLYSGAIAQIAVRDAMRIQIERIVDKLVSSLGLQGINSIDFIHNDAGNFVIDLNPRPTATLELYEHLMPEGWIKRHIEACHGELPVMPIIGAAEMHGQLIVYAPRNIEIPIEMVWPQWIKDRPGSGARIHQGEPLCSLYAKGATVAEVEAALRQRRNELLQMLVSPIDKPLPHKVAI